MEKDTPHAPDENSNIRIAVVGNVDSGKSTLVGVLAKGIPDDGRGSARLRVFNHDHEARNGRTSSITQEIMGFDAQGRQVLPERFVPNKNKYWAEVMGRAAKVVSLIDLCGHEKYLKTTLHGLMGIPPDYVLVVVGANMGVSKMTKEHLGIATSLDIPVVIAVTKVDMVQQETLQRTLDELREVFLKSKLKRKILLVEPEQPESVAGAAELVFLDRACPLFRLSSVTGAGLPALTRFLTLLRAKTSKVKQLSDAAAPVEFDVHEHLHPHGVGVVVSGLLRAGTVAVNAQLLLGPDRANRFRPVVVKSIHFNRLPVDAAFAGQFCCFHVKGAKKTRELEARDFRKGIVLLDAALQPRGCYGFEAEVAVLHHATTIHRGYECVLHLGVVRQTIKFLEMEREVLRTGDRSRVTVKFLFHAEFVRENATFMLREGRTKVVGQVLRLLMDPAELPALPTPANGR